MKRATIISIILGVCLLGAVGGGVFNYISLKQTIEQQQGEITLLGNQKEDLQTEIRVLETKLDYERERVKGLENIISGMQEQLEAATFRVGKDMLVKPTETRGFDCDDSALYMFYYFTNMGYEVKIITGNLDLVDESLSQCNHVWVLVKSGGYDYAYDWGHYFDYYTDAQHQHYEGYELSFAELVLAVLGDID